MEIIQEIIDRDNRTGIANVHFVPAYLLDRVPDWPDSTLRPGA
jgi:hypothetical protein